MVKILLLALLVLVLLCIAIGYALFYIGICRFPKDSKVTVPKKLAAYAGQIQEGMDWFRSQEPQTVRIRARDGTPLAGLFLPHPEAKGTAILVHGYRSDAYFDFSCSFADYYRLGYNLLCVYQRAHGLSGGAYITFGVKERFDVRDWARYVYDRFGPEHDIFLVGLSMGASSVLMASGTRLPESVRGIVADCGFTSPYEEFRHVLRQHRFPLHPFLEIAELFSRLFARFRFREYSTLEAMKVNETPVLFVHGQDDDFVPARFSQEAYEACRAEKTLILVPGAGHGASYLIEPEHCREALSAFFGKHSRCAKDSSKDEPLPSEL